MKKLENVLDTSSLELSSKLTVDEVIYELYEIIDIDKIASIEGCKLEEFDMKFVQDDFYENGTVSKDKIILDFFVNEKKWVEIVVDFSEEIIVFEYLDTEKRLN